MTLTANPTSLKVALNSASPGVLPDMFRSIALGDVIRQGMPAAIHKVLPVASPYNLATEVAIVLPDDAKAATILRAYGRTATGGGGTPGEIAPQVYGATPITNQCAVGPNGDIVFLALDTWLLVDVYYQPEIYDMFEITLPVAANTLTIPASYTGPGVLFLSEAEATTGGTVGKKIIEVAGAAPAATHAALNAAKTTVAFNAADAVTNARIKFGVAKAINLNALLEAAASFV